MQVETVINIQTDVSSGHYPFLIVHAKNDKKYQVKLPNYMTTSMMNEYIAYGIATNLSCILPQGLFIKFDESDIMDSIQHCQESSKYKELFSEYDINTLKNEKNEIILFGLEWITSKIHADDEEEFNEYMALSNDKNFYSLYSYDLYLYNQDRHIKNILFYQNSKGNYASILIDHDNIFGTDEGICRISELQNDYSCIKNAQNSYLYKYIKTREQKDIIHQYSKEIEQITTQSIDTIFSIFLKYCPKGILVYDDVPTIIKTFLNIRKECIVEECIKQEEVCYG